MPDAQQVAANLSQLLKDTQPIYRVDATTLTVQIGREQRQIYLPPQQGQPRGVQSR
ncbi:MAG: hypothetical protein AAF609_14955 [Cyanobacteria bacterium P01_C01_bin.120]